MFLKYLFILIIFLTSSLNACEKPKMPTNDEWNNWLIDVRLEAKEKNISDKWSQFKSSWLKRTRSLWS